MFSLIQPVERGRNKPGFSLVDLLLVVLALAVVAGILLPKMMGSNTRAKETDLRDDLKMLRNAIDAFHADTGQYPAALGDLAETDVTKVRVAGGEIVAKADWHGPYVESVPNDPVSGGAFRYVDSTGKVSCATSGPALNGGEYSSW
jgi:type II secretion system protein G